MTIHGSSLTLRFLFSFSFPLVSLNLDITDARSRLSIFYLVM